MEQQSLFCIIELLFIRKNVYTLELFTHSEIDSIMSILCIGVGSGAL